jgi:predicted amidohydrolase
MSPPVEWCVQGELFYRPTFVPRLPFPQGTARGGANDRDMTRTITVGALQLRAHDRNAFPERLAALLARIESACDGVDLLVVPESTFPAYVLGDDQIDDEAVSKAVSGLRAIASRTNTVIVAGAAIREGGRLRNTAVVIDADGSIAGSSAKIFLWHFDRKWFDAGDCLLPVRTSIGTLGALVCADGRLPEIASSLVDRGAEILVMPTAWVTSGRDPARLENAQADLLARVRAYENSVPFVAANKCGFELGMVAYCGKSQIVDARGSILAMASERNEELIRASVELQTPAPHRVSIAMPEQRERAGERVVRVALSVDPLPADIERRLFILDADIALAADDDRGVAALDRIAPVATIDAPALFDPTALSLYRQAGYRVAIVRTREASAWTETVARARAMELRMYVVVFDETLPRAYAVDPDGVVIAGTFDDFRIASAALDLRKTEQTMVAPSTDIAEGLELVRSLAQREQNRA